MSTQFYIYVGTLIFMCVSTLLCILYMSPLHRHTSHRRDKHLLLYFSESCLSLYYSAFTCPTICTSLPTMLSCSQSHSLSDGLTQSLFLWESQFDQLELFAQIWSLCNSSPSLLTKCKRPTSMFLRDKIFVEMSYSLVLWEIPLVDVTSSPQIWLGASVYNQSGGSDSTFDAILYDVKVVHRMISRML